MRLETRNPNSRRRGTAMIEFVLILPLLAVILGLTFFFGWALMHKHQVLVADRYSVWQKVETGTWPGTDDVNTRVFNRQAQGVNLASADGVTQTVDDLVGEASDKGGPRTQTLADTLLRENWPGGSSVEVVANFRSSWALWEKFGGQMHHSHAREGITWRRADVAPWNTLRDEFYNDLDMQLQRVNPPGQNFAQMIRGLYLSTW